MARRPKEGKKVAEKVRASGEMVDTNLASD
jgi:hypothetical protein